MKVALIHDWLVTNAGAEKVLKEFVELFPDSDVFSLVDFLNNEDRKKILKGKYAKTSFIQHLPFAKKYFRYYLPLFPKAIESLDVRGYDLIISSSWAVAKGVKKNKNQLHICYCHTPIRYAWDLYEEYTSSLKQPKKFFVEMTLKYIRKWDINTLDRVDYFVANSNFVKERIKRIYKRDAKVIYPPVEVDKFSLNLEKEDFYITVSRLAPYKKTSLIVEAFNKMPQKKLIVIGKGEKYEYLKKIAKSNIKILGYQPDNVVIKYLQKAKAFVYAAVEDFGIVPLEAISCGTPVIALNKGGTAETVIDSINGIHFENQDIKSIIKAVERFESIEFDPKKVRGSVFRYANFKDRFMTFLKEVLNEKS